MNYTLSIVNVKAGFLCWSPASSTYVLIDLKVKGMYGLPLICKAVVLLLHGSDSAIVSAHKHKGKEAQQSVIIGVEISVIIRFVF